MLIVVSVLTVLAVVATGVLLLLASSHKRQAREAESGRASRANERRAAESARKAQTTMILAAVSGAACLLLAVAFVVLAARHKDARESDDAARASTTPNTTSSDNEPAGDRAPPARPVPAFDAEGLPIGNDLDSVLTRLNRRFQQNDFFRYQLETENLRFLKKPTFTRGGEVFQAFRAHVGSPTVRPQVGTIAFAAWQQTLAWASKNEVPELCRMLRAEQLDSRREDLLGKLAEFKDARCAEAVAPFLAVSARRSQAEHLLKALDSTAEKFVLPYLAANHDKDTRVAALQVIAEVGTAASAKVVEGMTRDADPYVLHHSKIVFEKLSKAFGAEQDLSAAVEALKNGIAAQDGTAIHNSSQQLDKAYRPDHPKRAEIFKRLVECCKVPDPKGYGKSAAFLGAMKWSSAADVGALCELLVASGGESVVFLKLKEYKDPRTAEALAAFLTMPLKSPEAAAALKAIGAPAERAVVPYTLRAYPNGTEVPFATRVAAIELLGDIGTIDSVPVLRQHATELNVQADANRALTKIAARLKPK